MNMSRDVKNKGDAHAVLPVGDGSTVASAPDMVRKSAPGDTLTRASLRGAVYDSCPTLSRAEARKILDLTFDEIGEALSRGESVKLRSFGTFNVRAKRERVGRNPKTGVEATISPRRVLTFKASPVLVAHVNGDPIPEED